MNHTTRLIAHALGRSKERDLNRQEIAAEKVAAIVDSWYKAIFMASKDSFGLTQRIHAIHQEHVGKIYKQYVDELEALAKAGHEEAANALLKALPEQSQHYLIKRAMLPPGRPPITPSVGLPPLGPNDPLPYLRMPFWDKVAEPVLTGNRLKQIMKQVVFPPMSRKQVQTILYQQNVLGRIAPITKLVNPHTLISVITRSQSSGQSRADLIRHELQPLFQTTKTDAKRVARTAGALVSNNANMIAFQGLGAMLIGYQVHCVTDKASRPWHQERKNHVYYINPEKGQKGMRQCPHPPYEPEDINERPAGEPACAYNCRCFLSPVTHRTLELALARTA